MKYRILLVALMATLCSTMLRAQEMPAEEPIYLNVGLRDGNVLLKAIPVDRTTWFHATRKGLDFSVSAWENNAWTDYQPIGNTVLPARESAFANFDGNREHAETMSNILYNQSYVPEGQTYADIQAMNEEMIMHFLAYTLFSCYDSELSAMSGLQTRFNGSPSRYRFRVEVSGMPELYGTIVGDTRNLAETFTGPKLLAKPLDKAIKLSWEHTPYQDEIAAYQVFRSDDGRDFRALGIPLVFNSESPYGEVGMIEITDSIPQNYTNYHYILRGFDAFGHLTTANDTLVVAGRDITPPSVPMGFSVVHATPTEARFSWQTEAKADLLGFQIIASDSETGEYSRIHSELLPPTAREYTYDLTQRFFRFYRLLAVDTARNAAVSDLAYLVVVDTIPPPVPVGLTGTCDTSMVVTLSWEAPDVLDLKGYRVDRAYRKEHGFYPLTSVPIYTPEFRDTLPRKLDKEVYYRVVALDNNFNHSKPSEPLRVVIPDLIPPTAPLLEGAEAIADGETELTWRPSSSRDVEHYRVEVRGVADSEWAEVTRTAPNVHQVRVANSTLLAGNFVMYRVAAVDSSGNRGKPSNTVRAFSETRRESNRGEISSITYADGNVEIICPENHTDNQKVILVYRAVENGRFRNIGRSASPDFTDAHVAPNTEYRYRVAVLEPDGKRWELSDEVGIRTE